MGWLFPVCEFADGCPGFSKSALVCIMPKRYPPERNCRCYSFELNRRRGLV